MMSVVSKRKRVPMSIALGSLTAIVVGLAGWGVAGVALSSGKPSAPVLALYTYHGKEYPAADVPVLVYHEMNNDCKATAPVCVSHDPETVSTTQFANEMAYMVKAGYHTVTLAQYEAWLSNGATLLPPKPFLITADNGIFNFLNGAQEILYKDHFTATAFLVTGFANGATTGACVSPKSVGDLRGEAGVSTDPGCPQANKYWDATWPQLKRLSPAVWSFSLEAGPSGHYVQAYDPHCTVFDTCLLPGESAAQYVTRINAEFGTALTTLHSELGSRVNPTAWVVPYSDLGYPQCQQSDCTSQAATIPKDYLVNYAAAHFRAVFVEDAFRNGIDHERFRFDVNGQDTEAYFQKTLQSFISAGNFNRGN